MSNKKLTQERVRELLDYDPCTGIFTWKKARGRGRIKFGSVAGSYNSLGYRYIKIEGVFYGEHRLAWLWWYGYAPGGNIDHINRNPSDNRIENLRHVSQQCNMRNRRISKRNKTGVSGVSWDKMSKKWRSSIRVNGKEHYIGCFIDFDDAVCARLSVEQCLGWHGCDSSSSAYLYVKEMLNNIKINY